MNCSKVSLTFHWKWIYKDKKKKKILNAETPQKNNWVWPKVYWVLYAKRHIRLVEIPELNSTENKSEG